MSIYRYQNIGAAGLSQDVAAIDAPKGANGSGEPFTWTDAQNMRFREGYAEMMLGHSSPHGAPTVTPYGVFFSNTTTNGIKTVYMGLAKAYTVANTTHTNITRTLGDYTGTAADKWTGCTLSDILIVNNGVDDPQFWAGANATPMAKLTNWPANTKAKVVRSFNGALVAMNITESSTKYQSMVLTSSIADPGTLPASWTVSATNDATRTEGRLSETSDAIIDGLQLGQVFYIYKAGSTYVMRYIGGEAVYAIDLVSRTSGALAINCVAEYPGGHAIFADDDIVINTGDGPQSIIDRRMRRQVFSNLDSDNRGNSFVVTNKHTREVWFCYPTIGNTLCNRALIWNYTENTIGIRDLPNLAHANSGIVNVTSVDTWDSRTDVWADAYQIWGDDPYSKATPRVMMAGPGLYLADVGISFAGTPLTASCEHTGMDFDEPQRIKLCRGVRLRVDAALSGMILRVYVGSQDEQDGAITWSDPQNFTAGTTRKIDCLVSGRYLCIKFESIAQTPWRFASFEMDIEDVGEALDG